jgi:nucleoside-diphosphate-sugar epimerase
MRVPPKDLLQGVDAVINLGGLSNDPTAEYNPTANYEMNTLATKTLAEMCNAAGVQRFIFASSCSIYDQGIGNDDKDYVQDEDAPVAPMAAYSGSKRDAEKLLIDMVDETFCPVILRKGTIYGFSHRMRYDLVVNTFVKAALTTGTLTLHYGGEMWRPLVDVRDVARAYILALQADAESVRGQIFNVAHRNYRISELALRVQDALHQAGIETTIHADYSYRGVRSYRVSTQKSERVLGFRPSVDIEESVTDMVKQIHFYEYTDFENPRYYNIRWMKLLEEAQRIIGITGSVFEASRKERT